MKPASFLLETPPSAGVETVVSVRDEAGAAASGVTVRVIHRPDLPGSRELAIGVTDGLGRVRWTPDQPGTATLISEGAEETFAIGWPGPPPAALALLVLLTMAAIGLVISGLPPLRRAS